MRPAPIPRSLDETARAVATALHWPDNLGIELQRTRLPTRPETELLVVFVPGLADQEWVRQRAIAPLTRVARHRPHMGRLTVAQLQGVLPASRQEVVTDLATAIHSVLQGALALFPDGAGAAVLLAAGGPATRLAGQGEGPDNPEKALFGPGLLENVALVRQRLRDPALRAQPLRLFSGRAADTALLYLPGRAGHQVVTRVRDWLHSRARQDSLRPGLAAGARVRMGLLPPLMSTVWPDQVAALLAAGYAAVLLDGIPRAYVAPVTAPALLHSPGDAVLPGPVGMLTRLVRLLLSGLVVLGPAAVTALMEYHQEMLPTPFLLGVASVRENLGMPVVAEMLLLTLLLELIRATTFRSPLRLTPGQFLLVSVLLFALLVFVGITGPISTATTLLAAVAAFAIPSHDLVYMLRAWRWPMILAAGLFGLFGVASALFLLLTYLFRAESFGLPLVGEGGIHVLAPVPGPGAKGRRQAGGAGATVR